MECAIITKELNKEITQLRKNHLLFEERHYQCFCAYGHELHSLMQAIGEERSRAFQFISMCNNTSCDLDRFDPHYLQVILWDSAQEQLIGGYRIALMEAVVEKQGWDQLYLNGEYTSLSNLFVDDGKTFELSRAFISPTYQKSIFALYLLWKGVLKAFSKFPDYRYIIGSASISQQATDKKTQQLLIAGLRYSSVSDNSYHVHARNPYEMDSELPEHLLLACKKNLSFDEINELITNETNIAFKVPQLLRYYTEHFSARCLAYAIDENFGSIDILQRGTLNQTSRTLKKYISRGQ